MSTHTTLASRMIIDQLAPLLAQDSEEVNTQIKNLQAMLDASRMENLTLEHRQKVGSGL
jgi:hypothetical protein